MTVHRLTLAQKRALVLLNRGFTEAFFSLPYSTMVKLERAGYISPDRPNLVTLEGLRAAQ
jgi:hypothetical protein